VTRRFVRYVILLSALSVSLGATTFSPFLSVTYSGIEGSASASESFYLSSTANVAFFFSFVGGTANYPSCPHGVACRSQIDVEFSLDPVNLIASGGADYAQSADPGDPGVYNFFPVSGSATSVRQLSAGLYTAVLTLSSHGFGATLPATNTVVFDTAVEGGAASAVPEPSTFILGSAFILWILSRRIQAGPERREGFGWAVPAKVLHVVEQRYVRPQRRKIAEQ
jgi:hypothetical protein